MRDLALIPAADKVRAAKVRISNRTRDYDPQAIRAELEGLVAEEEKARLAHDAARRATFDRAAAIEAHPSIPKRSYSAALGGFTPISTWLDWIDATVRRASSVEDPDLPVRLRRAEIVERDVRAKIEKRHLEKERLASKRSDVASEQAANEKADRERWARKLEEENSEKEALVAAQREREAKGDVPSFNFSPDLEAGSRNLQDAIGRPSGQGGI